MGDVYFLRNQFLRLSKVINSFILEHSDEFDNDSVTKSKLEHLSDIAKHTASHIITEHYDLEIAQEMFLKLHSQVFLILNDSILDE